MTEDARTATTLTVHRNSLFWCYWCVVASLFAGLIWSARPFFSPNDKSRWNTVWSLVEYGTYEIFPTPDSGDKQQLRTIDRIAKDGKSYSSKPPLLPTVIAAYVKILRVVFGEPFSIDRTIDGTRVRGSIHIYSKATLLLFQLAPFLVFLIVYRRFLDRYARTDAAWCYCLLAAGLGTFVTGYLVTLNNHVIGATFGFFTASLLVQIWYERKQDCARFALAGLCAGWTAANELPAGLLVVVALAVTVVANWKKAMLCFLPPLLVVAGAFFWSNHRALDSLTPAYLQRELYDYDGSYWKKDNSKKSAIDALNDDPEHPAVYLLHMSIGHHGWFSLSPIWIIAAFGLWRHVRGEEIALRGLHLPILFVSGGVFIFFWLITNQLNYGGFCHGMRWLMWLSPFWLMVLPCAVDSLADKKHARRLAWGCLWVSIFSVGDTLYGPWSQSWLHRAMIWAGVVNY